MYEVNGGKDVWATLGRDATREREIEGVTQRSEFGNEKEDKPKVRGPDYMEVVGSWSCEDYCYCYRDKKNTMKNLSGRGVDEYRNKEGWGGCS